MTEGKEKEKRQSQKNGKLIYGTENCKEFKKLFCFCNIYQRKCDK